MSSGYESDATVDKALDLEGQEGQNRNEAERWDTEYTNGTELKTRGRRQKYSSGPYERFFGN